MEGRGKWTCQANSKNGWRRPTPLPDMFERFPPLGEEGMDDDDGKDEDDGEEDIAIAPPNYQQVFRSDRLSTRIVVIRNLSQHNLA
ncbi:hypothetical protein J1N35_022344 [Gossypium stocksii]|uniref:Uncharacterized protein n=1 Tax=Gossypium stocksii TaxID=47602 RepID=A0A9D4A265_9ROSI|nr:hypothetical protein J1N35_022344 [Gossypium stocksii]